MKKLCVFFIAFIVLLISRNVYADDSDYYVKFYYKEPVVGENPSYNIRIESNAPFINKPNSPLGVRWYALQFEDSSWDVMDNEFFIPGTKYAFGYLNNDLYYNAHPDMKWYLNDQEITEFPYYVFPKAKTLNEIDNTNLNSVFNNQSSGLVHIENIYLIDKNENVILTENASFNDLNLSMGFKFNEKDDYIKYKVTIVNDDSEDYRITESNDFNNSKYINYSYSFLDNSNIVTAHSTKDLFITVQYRNEVPDTAFDNGKYQEKNEINIVMANGDSITNPSTGSSVIIICMLLVVAFSLFNMIFNDYINIKNMSFIIICILMLIPISVSALKEVSIILHTNVEVSNIKKFCVIRSYDKLPGCGKYVEKTEYYDFYPGTTLSDIINNTPKNINGRIFNDNELDYLRIKIKHFSYDGIVTDYMRDDEIISFDSGCYDFTIHESC